MPYITVITYCKHLHSGQLSQTKEDLIISSTFTSITNLPNTVIIADVNAHLPLWYSSTFTSIKNLPNIVIKADVSAHLPLWYFSTFTSIKNLPNIVIIADISAHLPLWYSLTKDHKGELIKDILCNSNHIMLNKNITTCLSANQTQQPTSPDITTASTDLHDHTSWQTIHSITSDHHLSLLTTISKGRLDIIETTY